ncbi:SURF1 family protein [Aureimonas sp. ME7]|uniref:SURF1 family protein n=1 Tax=Aureimonas sp. ME7 TaxID=2744252 RepID=UPI0015F4ECC4|nr:SURF1 family protein [Aureimonas sp. ME7]
MSDLRRPAPETELGSGAQRPRSRLALGLLGAAGLLVLAVLVALGTWQVQRLFWKLDLIARVDARVHADPVPPPPPADWTSFMGADAEYRRLRLEGTFRHDRETLVQAVTELGPGFWVLTPLVERNGATYLVNRGFVPNERRSPDTRQAGQVASPATVIGLVRLPEPGGGFLRHNDPAADRWFSRDVAAIAQSKNLGAVAPFFVDADATANPGGYPIGGLTVIAFRNHHLVYALTWFTLAAMLAGAAIWIARNGRRRRIAGAEIHP